MDNQQVTEDARAKSGQGKPRPPIGLHPPEKNPPYIAAYNRMLAAVEWHEQHGWPSDEYEKVAKDCLSALWTAASNPSAPHIAEHLADKMATLAAARNMDG